MKKILTSFSIIGCFLLSFLYADNTVYFKFDKCSGANCLFQGVRDTADKIDNMGVITDRSLAAALQDFIVYVLGFLSLIALIYVIYAGLQLLLKPADEESAAKTKKIILGVISGVVIIWFAWWIVSMIFYVLDNGSRKTIFIPRAIAETSIKNIDFTTYSHKIEALETKISSQYDPEVMRDLSLFVDGAFDHMPDRSEFYKNKQLYDAVKQAIKDYNERKEIIDRGILQTALRNFLEGARVYTITSEPEATPNTGDAPLSVTLEAKQTIDESGTLIPKENYIWWVRAEGGVNKVIGRGNIINYTFDTSGTYTVFLTVNSASKNTRGFTDVISFEKSLVIEVGQPKVQFALKINDQLVNKVFKMSTKEAAKPVRIDASETRFASGYTIQKTAWDFGNGQTDSNEGNPQFETQSYSSGEYTLKLVLTRNDGEEFSYSVLIKIGDPLASISTTLNKALHKGEKAIFQAKKTSSEPDVQYIWEIKKQGQETVLFTTTGARLEYIFGDTGRFFVTLTSVKGDARDKDTVEVLVESRPPNVQFTADVLNSESPNTYFFDGSNTFDPDYPDNQKLRFEWFINDAIVQLIDTNQRNSRGKYTFPEKGTHRVMLRVTDEEGKTRELRRDIEITNVLAIRIDVRSEIVKKRERVIFTANAHRAKSYEWKIANDESVRTESNRFITSFPTAGIFTISVTATDVDGDTNTATKQIYVIEDDKPFSILDIKSDSFLTHSQKSVCSGQTAITVDRENSVAFSADKSVNRSGLAENLTYFWRIGLNKTSTQKNISYTFDELGCQEIFLTVSDKDTGATHTSSTWVKVVNLAPVFNDIQVDIENIDMDPMTINLNAVGARDPDGVIRSYTWYYFTDRDDQPQGFRITKLPEAKFVLPKITGRYYFALMMEDSNGLKVNTKEISNVPFSTPDLYVNTNLSTPIIENFRADSTEVKFGDITRLSLDVRTPVLTDVSDKSEYRWDIDGDGFYDIKTSTPNYEFKYVYPGEYTPKVKVTHKGISATKSLTIAVRNTLVPKANVQIIGNKIVAYNISSGIFQSANWYIDNKKISENKEYVVTEFDGSTPRDLKLEISDGKVTESVTYKIQKNLKNKVLLKKITRPLVILSSMSGDTIAELPDEIQLSDPTVPLFLYFGESRGDIRYYIVDFDTEVDTDLSGGKDDDGDNKGTASYRSGRPLQIPKGTKRVTTMKVRLLGNDNQDLDTRFIKIVRTYLVSTEPDLIPDNQAPKIFNLTQEDKDRIEKLRNLIQSTPEDEKKEYNKILDQLSDNWYDRADRIQTLNLFSNAVNASTTLSPDLKKKILEQISIVYTQGDEQIEERQLALKMIRDYLDKSPKKTQIFGNADTPGLINDIIDSPEYYEQNLKVIQKIMEDYILPDNSLSKEVKADIEAKLKILAGSPPAANNPPIDSDTTTSSGGSKNPILWIIGGILSILLGIIGVIYVRHISQGKNDGSETPSTPHEEVPSSTIDQSKEQSTISSSADQKTPDWLKEDSSPFGTDDVFVTKDVGEASEFQQPDWLQDNTNNHTSEVVHAENGVAEDIPAKDSQENQLPQTTEVLHLDAQDAYVPSPSEGNESEVPEWLQNIEAEQEKPPEPIQNIQEVSSDISGEKTQSEVLHSSEDDDIPDWLRGVSSEENIEPLSGQNIAPQEPVGNDNILSGGMTEVADNIQTGKTDTENTGNILKTETISSGGYPEIEPPTHLLAETVSEDASKTDQKGKKQNKKTKKSQKELSIGEHLLGPEHDMLLGAPISSDDPTNNSH